MLECDEEKAKLIAMLSCFSYMAGNSLLEVKHLISIEQIFK